MFIKWKKDKLRNKERSISWRAQVAHSYRDKVSQRVRTKFICYLATIKEAHRDLPVAQERFWREVNSKLARLSLSPEEEQQIREKLLERVPRPPSWKAIIAPYVNFSAKKTRHFR
jgi:hypothetical protein